MPQTDFLPRRDADLRAFAQNFVDTVSLDPAAYGFNAPDVASLALRVTLYATTLADALEPSTRTRVAVAAKNTARREMVALLRTQAAQVRAHELVTPAQRIALGLSAARPKLTPIARPTSRPQLAILSNIGRVQRLRLADLDTPTRRARPAGAAGAMVYCCVTEPGQSPPADLEQWRFAGVHPRSDLSITFSAADVGKTAHVLARWMNAKGQTGPTSAPLTGTIAA